VGEPIVMVVATSRAAAEDAADRVVIDYEPLPPVSSLRAAEAAEALAHDDVSGNLAGEVSMSHGDVEVAFEAADHIVSREIWVERGAAMPMETRGVIATFDPDAGRLSVHDTTQCPGTVRLGLARFFGLDEGAVDLIAPADIGGGFGVKIAYWYPEEVLVPFAAIRLGRPVKWIEDRREHFVGSNHERAQLHRARLALDDDGQLLGLEDRFLHEAGAYVPYGSVLAFVTASRLPSVYRIPNLDIRAQVLYTNAVPTTPFRGAGQPEAAFVIERMLDAAADELEIDRVEIRSRNLLHSDQYPYEPGTLDEGGKPTRYDSGDPPAVLNLAMELVEVDRLPGLRREAEEGGQRLGFGLGCYVESTGGMLYEGARVRIDHAGRVRVAVGSSAQGQGHETVMAQIAAEVLGVEPGDVSVSVGDTRELEHSTGTFGSRIAVIGGNAVAKAAEKVREQVRDLAAEVLRAEPAEIELVDGRAVIRGAPARGVDLAELAELANPLQATVGAQPDAESGEGGEDVYPDLERLGSPGLEATEYFAPERPVYAYGCHAAIVKVDPETFDLEVLRYAAVRDCGRELNPTIVDGQILGGIAQGIGGAFYEKMHYDDAGQLLSASFIDYLIPTANEVPEVVLGSVQTPSPMNPLGVKGTGQGGVMPVAPVIVGAVEDALGFPIAESPLSPARLFELAADHGAVD